MSHDLYLSFIDNVHPFIKKSKFPTEDVCRVFSILVNISSYFEMNKDENQSQLNFRFLSELVGRVRHSIYDIPKERFLQTFVNLIEV